MTRTQHDRIRAAIALITKVADELDEVLEQVDGEPPGSEALGTAIATTSTTIRQVTFPLTDALLVSEAALHGRVGRLPQAEPTNKSGAP